MKFNSFQKLTVLIYFITIINIMLFMVPFKNYVGNESIISYDFIWSDRKHIDFFRFLIFLLIPTIIFFLLIKYYQKYNSLSNELFNKELSTEKKVFSIYSITLFFVFSFLVISNLINHYKLKNSLNNKIKHKNEYVYLFKNKVFDSLTICHYAEISGLSFNDYINEAGVIKKMKDSLNIIPPLPKNYFIPPSDAIEVTNKISESEITQENNELSIKYQNDIYSLNDILRTLLLSNLILILLLFILRPTFLFVGSIFKETR